MTTYLKPGALVAGIAADYYLHILPSSRGFRLVETNRGGTMATLHGIFDTYDAVTARANELLAEEESASGIEQERFIDFGTARAFWANVAKENGWYSEPFHVQVFIDPKSGELYDSVASRALTRDVVVYESQEEGEWE